MDGDQHLCSAGKAKRLVTLENGLVIFVPVFGSESGRPAAFVIVAIDGIGRAESRCFQVRFSAAEFDRVGKSWIVCGICLDCKLLD